MTVRKCGICRQPGHNRRRCPVKENKSKCKVFGYTPLVISILDFLVTDNSYEQLYDLSKVSTMFQKAVHFITRKTVDIKFVDNAMFCNDTIKHLQPFTQLRSLNLSYYYLLKGSNGYISSGFEHLSSLTELTHLDVSYNSELPTNVLMYFKNNKKMQHLKISNCIHNYICIINNNSLSYLDNFPDLRYLNVRGCKLTNLSFLRFCPKLETLKFCLDDLVDGALEDLKFCSNLKSISIDCDDIDFKFISCIRSLERVHLIGPSKIDNNDVVYLKSLPYLNCLILDVCDNICDLSSLSHVKIVTDSTYENI